jgi:hypothetical protein
MLVHYYWHPIYNISNYFDFTVECLNLSHYKWKFAQILNKALFGSPR